MSGRFPAKDLLFYSLDESLFVISLKGFVKFSMLVKGFLTPPYSCLPDLFDNQSLKSSSDILFF